MKRFYRLIERLYDKKIDASGLAVFRVLYAAVLFCEICQIYFFRHLIYDKIPYIEPSDFDVSYGLILWMASVVMIGLGWYTRTATIVNYVLSLVFVGTLMTYEYHMFYAYMGVNFLLIWMNISQVASIDRLRMIWKYSNAKSTYKPSRKVSVLNYHIVIFVAIAVVYFDSIFYKFTSHNWMTGIGMWLPGSLSQVTHTDASWLLNQKFIALGLGYITLVFELVFIFTFFRKYWRVPLMIIGLGLHIGIIVEFPIPWFGLGVCGMYMLMVPVSWWKNLHEQLSYKIPKLTFFYDGECPLCSRAVIFLNHFDFLNAMTFKTVQSGAHLATPLSKMDEDTLLRNIHGVSSSGKVLMGVDVYRFAFLRMPLLWPLGLLLWIPGLYHLGRFVYTQVAVNRHVERCTDENCGYSPPLFPKDNDQVKLTHGLTIKSLKVSAIFIGLSIFMVLQINISYNSALIQIGKKKIGFAKTRYEQIIQEYTEPIRHFSKVFFGITNHPVFMDGHFNEYNHIIGVEAELSNGERVWLPMVDKDGHAGLYAYSFNWVKWTFRVNAPKIKQPVLEKGIRDYATFWLFNHDLQPYDVKFHIYVKRVDVPMEWEKDFLTRQKAKPWQEVGTAFWQGNEFLIDIPEIESIP